MKIQFTVPGDPVGYMSTTAKSKWTSEYKKYGDYAKKVRQCAKAAGIKIPLLATKERPLIIRTIAFFSNGRHCDPENVNKGVGDALFYDEERAALAKILRKSGKKNQTTGKGNDKYTGRSFPPPLYDKYNPRVIVIIKEYEPKSNRES